MAFDSYPNDQAAQNAFRNFALAQGMSDLMHLGDDAFQAAFLREFMPVVGLGSGIYNVMDPRFGATANGVTDDTTAIMDAVAAAIAFADTETEPCVAFPAGAYAVTSLDFVGASRVRFIALGAVIFYGISADGTAILDLDGGTTTQTDSIQFTGNFSVQVKGSVGASYQYGIKASYVTDSDLSITASGAYSVATMSINYSWDNRGWLYLTNSADNATALACGTNNVNGNRFTVRIAGAGNSHGQLGLQAHGTQNTFAGDISAVATGLDLGASIGGQFDLYMEANTDCVTVNSSSAYTAKANRIHGYFEVGTDGVGFRLGKTGGGSSQNTVISGRIQGASGGSNRTAIDLGTTAFWVDATGLDMTGAGATAIDTIQTGTWNGASGSTKIFPVHVAQWLGFPATQVPSTDANTLDDYSEGTFTPTLVPASGAFGSVTYNAAVAGSYLKIGRLVHVQGIMKTDAITVGTASGSVYLGGLPYTAVTSNGTAPLSVGNATGFAVNTPSRAGVQPASKQVTLYYLSASNGAATELGVSDLGTGAAANTVRFAGTYLAAT